MSVQYETVIGIEVHAQLKTRTKIFCSCPAQFGEEPNTNVCPVCLGLPGVLPVLNDEAVRLAVRTGLALNCTIARRSRFARKHYFYPDLPKGYQITQYTEPLAANGFLDITGKRVRIRRCHIEEDAGKLIHTGQSSLVDFNRCGVPLIEIVSEPDLRSAREAEEYVSNLRRVLKYLAISDADMEKGHFRAELNISVRPCGGEELFTQTEVKNLNSVRALRGAIEYETRRQIELHERGNPVAKQTLLWNEEAEQTEPMRTKETAEDYRYFPEPDLPPLVIAETEIERELKSLPELPQAKKQRYTNELGISDCDADVIVADRKFAEYYEEVLRSCPDAKLAANWLTTELLGKLKEHALGLNEFRVTPQALAQLLNLIRCNEITGKTAKEVFAEMARTGESARAIVQAKGLGLIADEEQLRQGIEEVLQTETALVAKYKSGKTTVLDALVGAVMKRSRGRLPPARVREMLVKKLS